MKFTEPIRVLNRISDIVRALTVKSLFTELTCECSRKLASRREHTPWKMLIALHSAMLWLMTIKNTSQEAL